MFLLLRGRGTGSGGPPPTLLNQPAFLENVRLEYYVTSFDGGFAGFGEWVNLLDDTKIIDPIVCEYGFRTDDITDRVAAPGQLTVTLNNAENNHSGGLGAYSPYHDERVEGFNLDAPVRLVFEYEGITWYKFFGRIADLDPDAGVHGERSVRLVAKDIMDDWMRQPVGTLPVVENLRDHELLRLLLVRSLLAFAKIDPSMATTENFLFSDGLEPYAIAFDNTAPTTTVREVIIDICRSGFGRFAVTGGTTGLPQYKFWNRHYHLDTPVAFEFDNNFEHDGIDAPSVRTDLASTIRTTTRSVTADAVDRAIWSLDEPREEVILANHSVIYEVEYTDKNGDAAPAIGVKPPWIGPPGATDLSQSDWRVNTKLDGTGTDHSGQCSCTAVLGATSAKLTFTNNTPGTPVYLRQLQIRGRSLYTTENEYTHSVDTAHGDRAVDIVMPYQTRTEVGRDVGQWVALILSQNLRRVQTVRFNANKSALLMRAALALDIGHRIAIWEDVLGLEGDMYIIRSVKLELHEGRALWCTWGLEPADTPQPWRIGIPGSSELGTTTLFGF